MDKYTKDALIALLFWNTYVEVLVFVFIPFGWVTLFIQPVAVAVASMIVALTLGNQNKGN